MFSSGGWKSCEKIELSSGKEVTIDGIGRKRLTVSAYSASTLTKDDESKLIFRIKTICEEYVTWFNQGCFFKMDPTEIAVDFSNVNFSNYDFNNIEGLNCFDPLKGKYRVYLIKDKDINNSHDPLLRLEVSINGKTREAVGEDYMKSLLMKKKEYDIAESSQLLQDFHSIKPPFGSAFFKDIYLYPLAFGYLGLEDKGTQIIHQLSVYQAISKTIMNFCGWGGETFKILEKNVLHSNENPSSNIARLKTFFLYGVRLVRVNIPLVGLNKENYRKCLLEAFTFSNQEMRNSILDVFLEMLKNHQNVLDVFLEHTKRRCYSIAGFLSYIYRENFTGNASKTLNFFRQDAYEKGVNQRIAIEALIKLCENEEITLKDKQYFLEGCCEVANASTHHYETWSLVLTLLASERSEDINHYLKQCQNGRSFCLKDLYWEIFKKTLALQDSDRLKYNQHFKPDENPNHHLLFGFFQTSVEEDSSAYPIFSDFMKCFLENGIKGYRDFRYRGSQNTHLKAVYSRAGGLFLKRQWINCRYEAPLELGGRKCRVYLTDDVWEQLTWGIGFNCLDPLDSGSPKHKALVLDGRNQLILLRDENNQLLAGAVLHLLLLGDESKTPVLVAAGTYYGSGLRNDNERNIAQLAVDKIVTAKANDMKIPFLALKFLVNINEYGGREKIPLEKDPVLIIKNGIFGDLTGVDYEMLAGVVLDDATLGEVRPYERREDCTLITRYLKIYSPPKLEISDSEVNSNLLFKGPDLGLIESSCSTQQSILPMKSPQ